jgi:hypothetical protein
MSRIQHSIPRNVLSGDKKHLRIERILSGGILPTVDEETGIECVNAVNREVEGFDHSFAILRICRNHCFSFCAEPCEGTPILSQR